VIRQAAAASALLLLAACSRQEADLGAAVRAYDDALVRSYARNDASPLTGLATAKEQGRVQVLVDLKAGGKMLLESRLNSLEVTSARESGDKATVETRERWRYHDRYLDPSRAPGPEFVADMRMRYELVREGGRWKVDSVATLSNEYVEPKGGKRSGLGASAPQP
jgi:hypothetical protein